MHATLERIQRNYCVNAKSALALVWHLAHQINNAKLQFAIIVCLQWVKLCPFLFVDSIDRTVRIWNTETPKKNKTVIKTKNKQGRSRGNNLVFTGWGFH